MNKKNNILFTSSTSHIAGGEINLVSLLNSIDTNKFGVYLAYTSASEMHRYIKNKNIVLIPLKSLNYCRRDIFKLIRTLLRLVCLLIQFRIKLVYFNNLTGLRFIIPIIKLLHIQTIAHIHIVEDDEPLRWSKIDMVDKILFPSQATMIEVMNNSLWIDKNKCNFVHNAVDLSVYYPRGSSNLKKELYLKEKVPVIGVVGQLKKIKGQHLFLEMAKNLIDKDIKANFLIVGDDNVQKGKYLKVLKDLTIELNIQNEVKFLGYRRDIPQIMSLCDLLVVPSLREPFGRVVIEAMACGTPVVASSVGGMKEIFEDGQGGLYCQVNDVDSLTEKVLYFFEHLRWWKEQKKAAYEFCLSKYRQEVHTKKIEEHILEAIANA